MVGLAGATSTVPSGGLVIVTDGGVLVLTVTVIGREVFVAPRSSEATAVSVCEPTARLTETWKGLEESFPSGLAPSKNCTLVTLPSPSEAEAWMVTLAGAMNVAPSMGLVILTEGGELGITGIAPGQDVG